MTQKFLALSKLTKVRNIYKEFSSFCDLPVAFYRVDLELWYHNLTVPVPLGGVCDIDLIFHPFLVIGQAMSCPQIIPLLLIS